MGSDTPEGVGSGTLDPRLISNHLLRKCVIQCLHIRTASDALPSIFFMVVTNGKISTMVFVGLYLIFISLWIPFWLLSFVVTEWGVYAAAVVTVFFLGRCIIRLIAFPGASQKLTQEIEKEFARYSVKMLVSGANSFIEVASVIAPPNNASASAPLGNNSRTTLGFYELPGLWRRAKTYRDRVFAVYLEVLLYIYQQPSDSLDTSLGTSMSSSQRAADLTKYGNNRLVGDIGNLSGLTPQARTDGRELMNRLRVIVQLADELELHAKPILESGTTSGRGSAVLGDEATAAARKLVDCASELRDFLSSLKPASADGESESESNGANGEEDPVDAMRRKFEEQPGSAVDAVKSGLSSIVPMLDPPPHTSIFGFDVQRGCTLSRYRGSRQLWVRRPKGGMIDVLHFPAILSNPPSNAGGVNSTGNANAPRPRNTKAVLYCNPNAGLIEVSTGMSLIGGNVPAADSENTLHDHTWTDYYTDLGFDVYVFNYAGYGRSFGTTMCVSGRNAGEEYHPGWRARLLRIFRSCFLTFTPTPDTLREDGVAVAQHLINDLGVQQLVIHGESIGGVAASATARYLSHLPSTQPKVSLLICDRTFCNLEAVAQRLVGGWTGYAIRLLAPFWSTDVAGDFLGAQCPKVVATDAADVIINDAASLKAGIALWKEIHRGVSTTKGIGWMTDAPLQYRMADWEDVCVNDSKYVASSSLIRVHTPTWPSDKNISVDEAFHFAACCKRIGKLARASMRGPGAGRDEEEGGGIEMDSRGPLSTSAEPLLMEAWKALACCDGLTGAPLGVAVKRGFDATVTWLCSCLVFGPQTVVSLAETRLQKENVNRNNLEVLPSDFDGRPLGWEAKESEGFIHPKPIPDVIDRLGRLVEGGDETLSQVSHELQYATSMLRYVQARLSAPVTVEAALRARHLHIMDRGPGSFLNLHCGHNNAFSKDEKRRLQVLLERATVRPGASGGAAPVHHIV